MRLRRCMSEAPLGRMSEAPLGRMSHDSCISSADQSSGYYIASPVSRAAVMLGKRMAKRKKASMDGSDSTLPTQEQMSSYSSVIFNANLSISSTPRHSLPERPTADIVYGHANAVGDGNEAAAPHSFSTLELWSESDVSVILGDKVSRRGHGPKSGRDTKESRRQRRRTSGARISWLLGQAGGKIKSCLKMARHSLLQPRKSRHSNVHVAPA